MHEMSVAINIIEIASAEAAKHNSNIVTGVEVEIGQLSGIEIDSLKFSFDIAKKNTPLQKANTKFILISAEAICKDCNNKFLIDDFIDSCPHCNNYDLEIIKGKELKVRSINID